MKRVPASFFFFNPEKMLRFQVDSKDRAGGGMVGVRRQVIAVLVPSINGDRPQTSNDRDSRRGDNH